MSDQLSSESERMLPDQQEVEASFVCTHCGHEMAIRCVASSFTGSSEIDGYWPSLPRTPDIYRERNRIRDVGYDDTPSFSEAFSRPSLDDILGPVCLQRPNLMNGVFSLMSSGDGDKERLTPMKYSMPR